VVKKDIKEKKNNSNKLLVGYHGIIGEKTSPEKTRSHNLLLGIAWNRNNDRKYLFSTGISLGLSHPTENYQGITFGLFTATGYKLYLGHGVIYLPLETSYKYLNNKLENENLNQTIITSGIEIPIHRVSGLSISLLGSYIYEWNTIYNYSKIYPTIRIAYYF
jgi:hypothetical protein